MIPSAESISATSSDANGKYIEISTGLCPRTERHLCATAASKVVSDKYSYEGIKELQYKVSIYPQLLSFARLRRVMYIFCGLVLISLLVTDHYSRKLEFIKAYEFEEKLRKEMKLRGYVLSSEVAAAAETAYAYANDAPAETTVVDFTSPEPTPPTPEPESVTEPTAAPESVTEQVPVNNDKPWPIGLDLNEGGNDNETK